ncbi:MAG: ROK family protein [Verrucomicrobiota bacterium]
MNTPLTIGMDFGGTSVKLGVCQGEKLVDVSEPIPTDHYPGVDALVEAMVREIDKLREAHKVVAIGVGVPGFVDFEAGFVYNLTNVPGWHDVPLKHILHQRTDLPVVVENDANAMAFAEWKCGAAKGFTNVVCITLGTGVGGALILNGAPYRGSSFGAGEIGQMSIDTNGRAGNYGNLGALEKYIGNQQIEDLARKRYANVGESARPDDCTPRHIAEAAANGDDIARQIWGEIGGWLGCALTSITWILNPDAIVVGGGVAKAGNLLFDPLKRQMQCQLNPVFWQRLQVLHAKFGNEAGMIGAAALAVEAIAQEDE